MPEVEVTKFLAVYLDKDLNWEHRTTQLYNKINSNQYLLGISKNFLDENNLMKLYYAHVYSHIQYGISAWGSMSKKSQLNDIYMLQKACLKSICRRPKTSNIMELFKKHKLLILRDIVDLKVGKFGYKLVNNILPNPLCKLANSKGGKKPTDTQQETKICLTFRNICHLYLIRAICVKAWWCMDKLNKI